MKDSPADLTATETTRLYDVIIAGAGPVGLFLACELALAQCAVIILEKAEHPHSPIKQLPFGLRGLSAPTIEAFDRRGLLKELEVPRRMRDPHRLPPHEQGTPPRRQAGHFAGIPFYEDMIDPSQWSNRVSSSTETHLLSERMELETVLARRAESLGAEIKRGFAITDFHQSADGVSVQAGGQSFQSKWLVGCDGSRSVVRRMGGFEFAGTEPEFTGYSAQIDLTDPQKLRPSRTLTPTGMYLQSQPGYLAMLEFDGGAGHQSKEPVTLAHLQSVLRRVSNTDVTISALHVVTTWTDRARQATAYRNGRVLLAGDAAHIHSPLGGQGLNLGLGDAMNLGWKLAATLQKRAPEGLLDSYQAERHPLGAQVLDWSQAQVAIMRPSPPARALHAIVRDLISTRDGATYFAGRVWGVSTHYPLGGNHALIGYSVPHFEFKDRAGLGELMRDGRGILLDFEMNASLKLFANQYGDQIKYVSAQAHDRLGVSAALIRPDGIIAWATNQQPACAELEKAAARWFVAPGI
jgi:2-polyprenyl-6-methoxyphenol hydroxylase-like FAD-dependent oxidoreductase